MPAVYLTYIIPPNAKVESLIIKQHNAHEIPGQFLVYPIQPPVISGETVPWVPPDTLIYNSDNKYPANFLEVINEGVIDGARIVTIAVHPLQYRPKSKQLLIISHINFEIAFGTNTLPEVRPSIRGKFEQLIYDAMFRNVIMNDDEIPAYYIKPTIVEENQIGQLAPFPAAPAMIITDSVFFNLFQPYVDWLTDQGIRANIISPTTIYNRFSGRDDAERIRNYIKYCYANAGGTYFILGGMDSRFNTPIPHQLPARRCFCVDVLPQEPPHYDTIPSDHYFCALDGDWNADGDAVWGEMNDDVDQFPEVYVGRILCRDTQEVSNWCYKALNYEKSPANINALDDVKWINQSTWPMGNAIDEFPDHFTHFIYTDPTAYEAFNVIDGEQGFTHAQTHGSILGFFTNTENPPHEIYYYTTSPPSPDYYRAGLNWLTNGNNYFIHYCIGCHTGFFDDPSLQCIAESFTTRYRDYDTDLPVGACASIEHTRYSLSSYSHSLQREYYVLLFSPHVGPAPPEVSSERIGVALAQAKSHMWWPDEYHRWVCYATNLFGSPTTPAWTKVPGNFLVSHPGTIFQGVPTDFTVTVKDAGTFPPAPLQYAKVCLNKPNDIYEVGATNSNGQITFYVIPKTTGTIKITVTRYHNTPDYSQYLPSQTICEIVAGGGGEQSIGSKNITPDHLCITQMPTIFSSDPVISYGVPHKGNVTISFYNAAGTRVQLIKQKNLFPGYHQKKIDTRNLSSGVYFIILREGKEKVSRKFVIIK